MLGTPRSFLLGAGRSEALEIEDEESKRNPFPSPYFTRVTQSLNYSPSSLCCRSFRMQTDCVQSVRSERVSLFPLRQFQRFHVQSLRAPRNEMMAPSIDLGAVSGPGDVIDRAIGRIMQRHAHVPVKIAETEMHITFKAKVMRHYYHFSLGGRREMR